MGKVQVKKFVFNTVQENTYVLNDTATRDAAIVDCGCMSASEQNALVDYIERNNLHPKLLLNTHLHFDHAWGNAFALKKWPHLKAYTHRNEVEGMPSPSKQLGLFGITLSMEDMPQDIIHYIQAGDVIELGESELKVLFVPGHSPGHVAFYCAESDFVMVGDVLFYEEIGRADLWGGNLEQLLLSIRQNLFTLPPQTVVYSGHGPETTIGHEIQYNPYFK